MEAKCQVTQQIQTEVDRIIDVEGNSYFVDAKQVVRDASGTVKGIVEEDVFYRFDTLPADN
jgi:hypothetical protein